MTRLWIGLSLLIAGGALFPYDFDARALDAAAIERFLGSCCHGIWPADLLVNTAAFTPFGYLGMMAARNGSALLARACFVGIVGAAFAAALQVAQIFLPSRNEDLQSVGLSVAAIAVGVLLGLMTLRSGESDAEPQDTFKPQAVPEPGHDADPAFIRVAVNLRAAQADFLDRLADEMAADTSHVCRHILRAMLPELESADEDDAQDHDASAAPSFADLDDNTAGPGFSSPGSSWTKRTLALDRASFNAVQRLADNNGHSVSRTIRHLIAAFMQKTQTAGRQDENGSDTPRPPRTLRHSPPARALPAQQADLARKAARHRHAGQRPSRARWLAAGILCVLIASGMLWVFNETAATRRPILVTAAPWAGRNAEILFDHHSHTTFSDGALSVAELAGLARDAGCNALAITDHSDVATTANDEQRRLFNELRQQDARFLLFGGVEINMPSYGRREHATVIVEPDSEGEVLPRMRDAAEITIEQARAAADKKTLDEALLTLAASYLQRGDNLLMIYNHPSREDRSAEENYTDIQRWNAKAPLFIGFAGAPGHQNAEVIGGYRKPQQTIDRWDPVVAEVGGTWDRLLSEGYQLWGAIAGSDFHNHTLDKVPCSFSRTHIAAAGLTYDAVLDALRAGTFWADHGRILVQLSLSGEVPGLETPIYPGSVVSLAGTHELVGIRLALQRGPGAAGAPLQVEFIGNCASGDTEILGVQELAPGEEVATAALDPVASGADGRSCFIRARVRLAISEEPDLMAYTNHIRFVLK